MKIKYVVLISFLCIIQTVLSREAYAGVEYVYVQKAIMDRAIIIRENGDIYLIEKGVGCLSLWRYEGKIVLVYSPGLFLGIGSKLLIPELGQECRVWSSEYLGNIKLHQPNLKSNCTEKHWIKSVIDSGSIIILEDGSIWKVDSLDRVSSMLWLPTEDVIICNGRMINLSNGEEIGVIRLK